MGIQTQRNLAAMIQRNFKNVTSNLINVTWKPNFEFEDLKMSGEAVLGMNGVILPDKEAKPVPVKDLVVLVCAPQDFQTFLHPYKQEWEFSIELD
jgi:hypothetical protein